MPVEGSVRNPASGWGCSSCSLRIEVEHPNAKWKRPACPRYQSIGRAHVVEGEKFALQRQKNAKQDSPESNASQQDHGTAVALALTASDRAQSDPKQGEPDKALREKAQTGSQRCIALKRERQSHHAGHNDDARGYATEHSMQSAMTIHNDGQGRQNQGCATEGHVKDKGPRQALIEPIQCGRNVDQFQGLAERCQTDGCGQKPGHRDRDDLQAWSQHA